MNPNPLLSALGYDASARLVIFHADDVGMCYGSNRAFVECQTVGLLKTGSVMMPCPWSPEIVQTAAAHPSLDLGVHLTLTSEWPQYRWGPISTRQVNSGLLDPTGHFWASGGDVAKHLNPTAAIGEMEAQIERALAAGMDMTHLDTHMGTAMLPGLWEEYVRLGFEYRVPVLFFRQVDRVMRQMFYGPKDETIHQARAAAIEERGMPLVDWFRITPGYDGQDGQGDRSELYESILRGLLPGITYFSLHPNAPGDINVIDPVNSGWRTHEYDYFRSDRLRDFLAQEGIVPIGFREIRDVMRGER
ncbi:MAG TPA: polysaccharide deacetylase family protein [Caldilineaceae bacterium]|nr:polysaccharide deacetylase family protein [Caldilineaceae bacterium]